MKISQKASAEPGQPNKIKWLQRYNSVKSRFFRFHQNMIKLSGEREVVLVSACLVGIPSRYDGKKKPSNDCLLELANKIWIPVCPEQLGGLPTPRSPVEIINGDGFAVLRGEQRIISPDGDDVTENFIRGAEIVLRIAQSLEVRKVFLKSKSPSCGISGRWGVTAARLSEKGFELYEY
jgi:uncharacterized protein YbbK (DUF523 family)